MSAKSLIIGYGNALRGDDNIGLEVANTVASWHLPQVTSLALPQLTPEIAVNVAQADLVIFVDANFARDLDTVKLYSLDTSATTQMRSHFSSPQTILSLAQALYGKCPQAWWLVIPGVNFQIGDRLSATAKQGIDVALDRIKNLITKSSCTKSASCKTPSI